MSQNASGFSAFLRSHRSTGVLFGVFALTFGVALYSVWSSCRPLEGKATPGTHETASPPVSRVRASDIGHRVVIDGRLGYPIGEVVTIQGEWSYPAVPTEHLPPKNFQLQLVVTAVNGKQLLESIKFPTNTVSAIIRREATDVPRQEGDVWELRVAEIGGFHGTPSEALLEATGGFVKMQQSREFGFSTELLYCSCRIVRHGSTEATTNPPTTAPQAPAPKRPSKGARDPFELE